jgi:glycosyltransferase involved in cell wall biosynthesis
VRIFINALSARQGGGQTYLQNLLKHIPTEKNFQIFILVQPSFYLSDLPSNVKLITKKYLENPILRAIWEESLLISMLKQLKIDLFFSPGGMLPRSLPSNLLTAVTFQNMMPFDYEQRKRYPYGYRRLRDWILERTLSSSMRRADLVIFISEFAKDFIANELGYLQGKSIVVPHGIDTSFRVCLDAPLPHPNWLPKEDYFLYVSYIDHYKAQLEVVHGFYLYLKQGGFGKLVLVGPESRTYGNLVRKKISNLGLSNFVIMTGSVPHAELPAAYQNARVNIFASLTENCPNILLEMMASGRPALVSNRAPMTEFGEGVVAYFDPSKSEDFACNLAALIADEERQYLIATAAIKRVAHFTWERAACLTWNAIAKTQHQDSSLLILK